VTFCLLRSTLGFKFSAFGVFEGVGGSIWNQNIPETGITQGNIKYLRLNSVLYQVS